MGFNDSYQLATTGGLSALGKPGAAAGNVMTGGFNSLFDKNVSNKNKFLNVATGGISGMIGSLFGKKKPAAPMATANQGAQDYFNAQSAEDQANIRNSWGGARDQNAMLNQWYQNAGAPGAQTVAPQPQPQPNAGYLPGYQPPQPPQGGTPTSNMLTNNYPPPAAPVAARNIGDEYEAWKAGGRVGPRPQGT